MSSKKNSITNYVQKTLMQFLGGSSMSSNNHNKNTSAASKPHSHKKSPANSTNGKNTNATPKKKRSPSKPSTSSNSSSKKAPPSQSKSSAHDTKSNKLHKKGVTTTKNTKGTSKKASANKQTLQSTSDSEDADSEEAASDESEEEEDEASEESGSEYTSGDDDESNDSNDRKNGKVSSSLQAKKKSAQSASKKKTPAKSKKVSSSDESDEEMEEEEEEGEEEGSDEESSEASSPRPVKSQKKSQSSNQKSSNKRKRSSSDEEEDDEEEEEEEAENEGKKDTKKPSSSSSSSSSSHLPPPPPLTSRPLASPPSLALSLHDDDEADIEPDRRQPSKVKHIDLVQIGKYELTTWYYSPYPDPYRDVKKLFLCQYCLKYCKEYKSLVAHMKECQFRRPPGKLIYQDGRNAVFEVDGSVHKLYCQCLCLFAKLFIDHKTLYYDVAPFLFYVLTEVEDPESGSIASPRAGPMAFPSFSSTSNHSYQVVAYFSKEKQSPDQFNLSCILSFPQYQRRGYGKFLIALSYELSRREHRIGSPEKPLSELGKVSYKSYWISELLQLFANQPKYLTAPIVDICNHTAIKKEDLISSLDSIGLIKYKEGDHHISATSKQMKDLLHKHHITAKSSTSAATSAASVTHAHNPLILEFKPSLLHWNPPAHSTSSPSVSFPPSSHSEHDEDALEGERKTNSHVKKKIKY